MVISETQTNGKDYGEMGYGSAKGGFEDRVGKQGFRFQSKLAKILLRKIFMRSREIWIHFSGKGKFSSELFTSISKSIPIRLKAYKNQ